MTMISKYYVIQNNEQEFATDNIPNAGWTITKNIHEARKSEDKDDAEGTLSMLQEIYFDSYVAEYTFAAFYDRQVKLIVHGLKEGLEDAQATLDILKVIRDEKSKYPSQKLVKELWYTEELPDTLQNLTVGEILEQVDPWRTLCDEYKYLIEKFNK